MAMPRILRGSCLVALCALDSAAHGQSTGEGISGSSCGTSLGQPSCSFREHLAEGGEPSGLNLMQLRQAKGKVAAKMAPAEPRNLEAVHDDMIVAWLRRASASAKRLTTHLLWPGSSPYLVDRAPSSSHQSAQAHIAVLQNRETPTSGSVDLDPIVSAASPLDDILTIVPGLLVVYLLLHLVVSFLGELRNEDKAAAAASADVAASSVLAATKGGDSSVPGVTVEEPKKGSSSGPQTVFNIVKNIVGEGMLSLPAGVAAGTGILGAMVIATGFCVLLGYTFSIMGRVCHATGGKTHKDCAKKADGPILAQTMAVTLMLKTGFTCLSYAIVIGESYSRIFHYFGFMGVFAGKQSVLIAITLMVLVPLCLQRDLSILSYTSLIGICGEFSVVVFMQVRYVDGSYDVGGRYYEEIAEKYRPEFGPNGVDYWGTSAATFVLLSTLSTAFIAHYNGPKFYVQMKAPTIQNFNKVVTLAFLFSLSIYLWVMSVGYLTFGKDCDGLILNNYSEKDGGATFARICIGFAVLFGFPLAFTALRDATCSTFGFDNQKQGTFAAVTFGLLIPITAVGCLVSDLGLVNALGGAIFGGLIVLVFPGLLLIYAAKNTEGGAKVFSRVAEQRGAWVLVAMGLVLCLFGSTIVLLKKFSPSTLKH